MFVDAQLEGNCARCGSTRMVLEANRRRVTLPTCNCKEETLRNTINAVLDILEREITEPWADQARMELQQYITEFDE